MAKRDKLNSVPLQQYFDELRAADQRALTIKQTADENGLVLAREIQTYKDEQHNGLLKQLGEERGHYVNQAQHTALLEKMESLVKPLQDFMVSQIAAGDRLRDYRSESNEQANLTANQRQASASSPFRANLAIVISAVATLVSIVILIVGLATHHL